MENLLDSFFDKLEQTFKNKSSDYIVQVSEVKGSFYVLIRKPRGKILNENLVDMFDSVKSLSEKIYSEYAELSTTFRYRCFPYVKLIRWYGNYHYHFLVVKKDYQI